MRSLALFGLAKIASAFLIVPEVSKIEVEIIPDEVRDSYVQSVNLTCPGCPVRMPHSRQFTTEVDSHLKLDFSVDLSSGNRLLLNGFEVYPHTDPFSIPLSAPHIVDVPSRNRIMRGDMLHHGSNNMMNSVDVLGFTLISKTHPPKSSDDVYDHVKIDLQIIEVSNIFVDSIPAVHIHLLRDNAGLIAIEHIEIAQPESITITAVDSNKKPKCNNWLCSMIQSLKNHWNHWRPHCGKSHRHPHNGTHHGHHGHHSGDKTPDLEITSHGHEHRRSRAWGQIFKSIVAHVLLPVFIGIIAGIIMSTLGMLVGTMIVHVYRFFFRSPSPRGPVITATSIVYNEKDSLMEYQEPPPSYEKGTATVDSDTKV